MRHPVHRLPGLTIALHWSVALGMIVLLGMGLYMTRTGGTALHELHQSLGIGLFAIALVRSFWWVWQGWPEPLDDPGPMRHFLSLLVRWTLLLGSLALPVSGMAMSVVSGRGLPFFGTAIVAAADTGEAGQAAALDVALADVLAGTHATLAYVVIAALGLHVAAALKHHCIDGNDTLRQMLPGRGAGEPIVRPAEQRAAEAPQPVVSRHIPG